MSHQGFCPVGAIIPYAGASAPNGWLLCDGTNTHLQATYPVLYALITNVYGAGSSGTTFKVPDFRDRMPVGKGSNTTSSSNHDCTTLGYTSVIGRRISATDSYTHSHASAALSITGSLSDESSHTHGVGSLGMGNQNANHQHIIDGNSAGTAMYFVGGGEGSSPSQIGTGSLAINNARLLKTDLDIEAHQHAMSGSTAAGSAHNHGLGSLDVSGSTDNSTTQTTVYYPPCVTINYIIKY